MSLPLKLAEETMARPRKNSMKGNLIVPALRAKFQCATNSQLAQALGYSALQIRNIERRMSNTPDNIANIVYKSYTAGLRSKFIEPLIEFMDIEKGPRKNGSVTLHFIKSSGKDIIKLLKDSYGIYIFFDSGGKPIYVGKAPRQNIFTRATQSFNANLNHEIFRNRRTPKQQLGQPRWTTVKVHDVASYFSAYKIQIDYIPDIEAILTRCMINATWNRRVEGFQ